VCKLERPEPELRKGTYRTARRTRRTPPRTLQNTVQTIPFEERPAERPMGGASTTKGTSLGKERM
jgi:hypothetical protein